MELRDFIVTPIWLFIIYAVAYWVRPRFTDENTRRYFIPALTVKIIGAICVGLVYYFYYSRGGDTTAYFDQSKVLYSAFFENPSAGVKLLFDTGGNYFTSDLVYEPDTYNYASRIRFYGGKSEYFVVKMSAFLGLFCFHTYTSIAAFFAVISFSGLWALFISLYNKFRTKHLMLALAIFFLPSVVFWGSGIMKDTVVIAAIGWTFYGVYSSVITTKFKIWKLVIVAISLYVVYTVKIYVLFSFIPSVLLWIFLEHKKGISNKLIRILAAPALIFLGLLIGFYIISNISEGDKRYNIDEIGERTRINAEYLYYVGVKNEGSSYYLGELDGSIQSMIKLAPAAINVTLYRPYLWEVQNPLMLLSFIESFFFFIATISVLFKPGFSKSISLIYRDPFLIFCFMFSLILAIGVGLNSFNFGTLVRYKIPLLPFFIIGIFGLKHKAKIQDIETLLRNNEK